MRIGVSRSYYADSIAGFLGRTREEVLGRLTARSAFDVDPRTRDAWLAEVDVLQRALRGYRGAVYLEFDIPRLGKRIDAVVVIGPVVFVLEFKAGEREHPRHALDQVCDYALDLRHFHESSHACWIAPVLIPTLAEAVEPMIAVAPQDERMFEPVRGTVLTLPAVIERVLACAAGVDVDVAAWESGGYRPTPTIIEAATALYGGHRVEEISRGDAGATNLGVTSEAVAQIIRLSRSESRKSICFVTGVPGAGKTLVGLNMATRHHDARSELYSVFLSGNGPLVTILREALARDKARRAQEKGDRAKLVDCRREVLSLIQPIHHFIDDCLQSSVAPVNHVVLFDEAQRAWDLEQTSKFMRRKKGLAGFVQSEPEFLIGCLDRHRDWAAVVCLVGGGQEINTGEAGIGEWLDALRRSFPHWHVYLSSRLTDAEYGAGRALEQARALPHVRFRDELHLAVSMRSFRAEHVSTLVKRVPDLDTAGACATLQAPAGRYPIRLTRSIEEGRAWVRAQARWSERFGLLASSQALRLKPLAVDVRSPLDPVHWFLDGKDDVRSSYYLEDAATEFHVQGLELDWACVVWDADLRHAPDGWQFNSFCGSGWRCVRQKTRQRYLLNAYRVLLTRARQGMVVVVPGGDPGDPTRLPAFYDATYRYLCDVGFTPA